MGTGALALQHTAYVGTGALARSSRAKLALPLASHLLRNPIRNFLPVERVKNLFNRIELSVLHQFNYVGTGALARARRAKLDQAAMTYYRRVLPHIHLDHKFHFITFATHERRPLPLTAKDITLRCCLHDNRSHHDLAAAVVMPDHVHLVLRPLILNNATVPIHLITGRIKGAAAHAINKDANRNGPVWQDESFDHVVRIGDLYAKINYVLENPVRKHLVGNWRDYLWCWCSPELAEIFR